MPNTSPPVFITIDPGLQCSGAALWVEEALWDVQLVRAPAGAKGIQDRITIQCLVLRAMMRAWGSTYLASETTPIPVVCERMFHRHYRGNRVDPNDLINLNLLAGRLGSYYILPSEWKGNVPRDVEQSHTTVALRDRELALVENVKPASLRKEAWSAVGIGLSVLGRAHQQHGWRFS